MGVKEEDKNRERRGHARIIIAMSSERSSASRRPARTPVTPRVAGGPNATAGAKITAARPIAAVRSEPLTPRVKQAATTPISSALSNGNVTPRSSARSSRVESASSTPTNSNGTPTASRAKSMATAASVGGVKTGLGINGAVRAQAARPRSLISETGSSARLERSPIRSPLLVASNQSSTDSSMFFHASDAPKQVETVQKAPEIKKPAAFFYADGQQEAGAPSPVLSAVSDQKSTGPWIRSNLISSPPGSPPILSPSLSSLSNTSPFFAPAATGGAQRPYPPSKENIHLSYRKGASQIFGTRPAASPRSTGSSTDIRLPVEQVERRGSVDPSASNVRYHQKSPSLSSIDSGNSPLARRRSATTAKLEPGSSPLASETVSIPIPRLSQSTNELPSIDTSLEASGVRSPDGPLSPSKGVPDFAAEARRERKVLDLEISNSSLLAINASLEREVRRQKTELKRFRRLSRAGRFSFAPGDWSSSRVSDGLSVVGEEDEDDTGSMFGPPSGLSELYDDMSDDDDESLASSAEPLSPSGQSSRERDQLAKDEKRLRLDLDKHKELLVQSQAMNHSIKRCTYATEDMIREGRKALEYHVRVSDVKLGGRVLSSHEDDDEYGEEIEVIDNHHDGDMDHAKGFLDVWAGVGRPSFDGSEGGDRDSGIEIDRIPYPATIPLVYKAGNIADSGRPLGDAPDGFAAPSPGLS